MQFCRNISCAALLVVISLLMACQAKPLAEAREQHPSLPRLDALEPYRRLIDITVPVKDGSPCYAIIPYAAIGDPNSPPMIIVPGNPGGMGTAAHLALGVSANELYALANYFRVIIVELPGQGLAQMRDRPYGLESFDNLGAFLHSFVLEIESAELRGRKFHLVGHSYGGEVSWRYALRHPTSLASLTLIDSSGFPRTAAQLN